MRSFTLLCMLALLALYDAATISTSEQKRYDNFSVYKIQFTNKSQREILQKLIEKSENYNIWHDGPNQLTLMVSSEELIDFKRMTNLTGMHTQQLIANVQELIDAESSRSTARDSDAVKFGWTKYYGLNDIEKWLDDILAQYPEVTQGFVIGQSYEGREIRGIKISYKSGNPGIFIESNIHAREWISSATATWLINELLTSTDDEVRRLAEDHDWYIVPVLNVDGFEYSHAKDRLWRKTRQPSATSPCIGADANRNFDSHWMENDGASNDPCDDTYAGSHPLSEPEVKAMTDYVTSIKDKLNILLAFHSFGQELLTPYGYTDEEFPENYDDLIAAAKAYADAVKSLPYGTVYNYYTAAASYVASGMTNDWAYIEADIKLSYIIEFRDTGDYGFVLPPDQILPNCEETLTGILALVKKADELGYLKVKY